MKKKFVRVFLIPSFLLLLWLALTLWYIIIFDQSVFVLSYKHDKENLSQITHERLQKGQKLTGQFIAAENNLGIVSLRFKSFLRIPYNQEDILTFRIKQKGQTTWYYENDYRSGLTFDVPFLPFGFPVIADSKGKTYYFELESLQGNKYNGIALSNRSPFLMSKYLVDKSVLISNPKNTIAFIFKKFFYSFRTIDIVYSSFVFTLPLLFYLFWISPAKLKVIDPAIKRLGYASEKAGKRVFGKYYIHVLRIGKIVLLYSLIFFLLSTILVDVLFLQVLNDLLYIVVIFLWPVLIRIYKIDTFYSYLAGLFCLAFAPLVSFMDTTNIAEKATAWAFIFFVVGFIQNVVELKKQEVARKKNSK